MLGNAPEILAHVRTTDGLAFQLRRDPAGVLEVPPLQNLWALPPGLRAGAEVTSLVVRQSMVTSTSSQPTLRVVGKCWEKMTRP